MNKVGEKSRLSAERLRKVAESVSSISGFVATIRSIADQTNLLALNAAIEAARAGEAGRGFAVVAEEVRKLAEESAGAAKEVETLITSLQTDTKGSLEVTEESGKVLEGTIAKAHEAQAKLQEALGQIARVNDAMQNIAATSEEQAAASGEMAQGIDQATKSTIQVVETIESIRHSTEETAHASESVAQESQKLAEGAEHLKRLLARFILDQETGTIKSLGSGR
ncbi:methyl-accepting chemotaxis protein [Aminomonas paucivorans]|uniref:methyl-accepting chemotaxis protein n=1 Tax=Aminomonas paucivorans TaxID=81412 RepID=UPI001E451E91